tara:strand:- start:452 stop:745 length:294 start_codon:yes stop_codon:yes gene_type:complete
MTCLKDVRDRINSLIEKHGEYSPCWYSIWTVESFQSQKQEDHEFWMEEYKRDPQENYNPGEFEPWTDKEMVIIAERMMSNYNPAKEFIAYNEASSNL